MRKFLSIIGVRPQFVKAAMVCAAVERFNQTAPPQDRIQHLLLNTGQHYDFEMAEVFFQQLPLPAPDFDLGVGSGSHGAQTAAMLQGIEEILVQEKPDFVIVYGDTNSTLAGALAAVKLHIPVAHVESGLRSFNRLMPEEINRLVADHVSDVLLCPTYAAVEQLAREGVVSNVHFCGDVMLDAVREFAPLAAQQSQALDTLGLTPRQFILVTIHRAENTDSLPRMEELADTLCRLDRPTVFAMHPRLRAKLDCEPEYRDLKKRLFSAQHLRILAPLPYLDMLQLEANAQLVMTDSGGVQKEAYFLGTPCLTLRDETEWTETLQSGWNRVVGTSPEKILPLVQSLWSNNGASPESRPALQAFGDGAASDRIIEILQETCSTRSNSLQHA
ncbi:MAG: UDP-N-acetylglucosamine 2-epimerase (non-hydrolyzing) [Acidobacteriia bacterium]|nr:UDP-N-acetylglucosamine 2-epimerase (non-hydrolyzing) [Terriglobia bacterium]